MGPRTSDSNATVLVCYRDYKTGPSLNQHSEDYIVIANDAESVQAWRKDKSMALMDVLQSFDIFSSRTGSASGILDHTSNQNLE